MFIGSNIRRLRKAHSLTQLELAEKLGVTSQAVSKWENCHSAPDISLLPKIADMFGVTLDELVRLDISIKITKEAKK